MIRPIARFRSALTLVEVLVGLMILSVVGTAMVGVLLLATSLYQRGEAARGASDETMAVLAQLDADLARMVPRSADGWLYAKVADAAGNCVLAFTARHETTVTLDNAGTGLSQPTTGTSGLDLIVWWTTTGTDGVPGALASSAVLCRAAVPIPASTDPRSGWFDTVRKLDNASATTITLGNTAYGTVITTGCLHFSAWFAFDGTNNSPTRTHATGKAPDWETRTGADASRLPPVALTTIGTATTTDTNAYDSDMLISGEAVAWPLATRFAMTLTGGGRHVSTGRLVGTVDEKTTALRFSGLGPVPEFDGYALVRIDNEWVRGTMSSGGWFNADATTTTGNSAPAGRGARRSVAASHDNAATVVTGLPVAIVRSLPH